MSSRFSSDMDTNTPTHCFHKLCQVMLDGSSKDLTKKNIEDFRVILHIIMHECSKANIESGKVWISEHCRTPIHATALMEYILSLSKSRKGQQERIHLIYLISDILFHAARRQLHWLKESILSLLVPLLCLAYESTETSEYKAKVIKVISLWGDNNIFEPNIINYLKQSLNGQQSQQRQHYSQQQQPFQHQYPSHNYPQQTYLPPQQQYTNYNQPSWAQQPPPPQKYQPPPSEPLPPHRSQPPPQRSQPLPPPPTNYPPTPPQKPYFELPAGLMMIAKSEDYTPIHPSVIKLIHPRPPPTKEILEAVNDFYKKLDVSLEDDSILEEKHDDQIDAQGWEKGYLDFHFKSIANRKREKETHRPLDTYEDKSSRSYNRRHSPRRHNRSPSPRRMSPPRRNYSPPPSRGISPPPRRSSPPRRHSPPPRDRYRSRRYSRSRSPPPPPSSYKQKSRGDFGLGGGAPPENRYLGLGNAVNDEFDSFRRNKSQAYNRREPHQPMTCYKCNKVGHLARECQSL